MILLPWYRSDCCIGPGGCQCTLQWLGVIDILGCPYSHALKRRWSRKMGLPCVWMTATSGLHAWMACCRIRLEGDGGPFVKGNLAENRGYFYELFHKYVRFVRSNAFFRVRFGAGSGLFVQVIHAIEQGRGATLVLLREGRPTQLWRKSGQVCQGQRIRQRNWLPFPGFAAPSWPLTPTHTTPTQ